MKINLTYLIVFAAFFSNSWAIPTPQTRHYILPSNEISCEGASSHTRYSFKIFRNIQTLPLSITYRDDYNIYTEEFQSNDEMKIYPKVLPSSPQSVAHFDSKSKKIHFTTSEGLLKLDETLQTASLVRSPKSTVTLQCKATPIQTINAESTNETGVSPASAVSAPNSDEID